MSPILEISITRLALAALLGGLIGLDREAKHRPAGLRTNLFICVGAAMFTLLSHELAGEPSDYTRIAAQIIPGIGFIGAGSISLGALSLLGYVERFMNLKVMEQAYEVTGQDADLVTAQVNEVLEPLHFLTQNQRVAPTPQHIRVHFEVSATRKQHEQVLAGLRQSGLFESVTELGTVHPE
jgi:putative Mg2+ transporter-C (MgtC) family protein